MGAQLETTGKWLIFPIDILKFIVFYFLILLETFFFLAKAYKKMLIALKKQVFQVAGNKVLSVA